MINFMYIDPSVMTYAIQAVTGIIIAIGAFVGVYLRKAKKKVAEKLNIDENRNKEVESDDIIVKTVNHKSTSKTNSSTKTTKNSK